MAFAGPVDRVARGAAAAAGRRGLDLARREERRLALAGDLLPGDILRLRCAPRMIGRC